MRGLKIFQGFCWFSLAWNVFAAVLTITTGGTLLWVSLLGIGISGFVIWNNRKTMKAQARYEDKYNNWKRYND